MTVGLYVLLLGVVYPRLTELLASLGGRLPPLTRGVITASHVVGRWWPAAAGFALGTPLLVALLRKFPATGLCLDRWFLRLPLLGAIYRDLTVALICKVFSSLYRANKPAPEIVELCAKLVGNQAFRRGLRQMREEMTAQGSTVTRAFGQSGLFPLLACMTIDVGEQSGQIARAMDRRGGLFQRPRPGAHQRLHRDPQSRPHPPRRRRGGHHSHFIFSSRLPGRLCHPLTAKFPPSP